MLRHSLHIPCLIYRCIQEPGRRFPPILTPEHVLGLIPKCNTQIIAYNQASEKNRFGLESLGTEYPSQYSSYAALQSALCTRLTRI